MKGDTIKIKSNRMFNYSDDIIKSFKENIRMVLTEKINTDFEVYEKILHTTNTYEFYNLIESNINFYYYYDEYIKTLVNNETI